MFFNYARTTFFGIHRFLHPPVSNLHHYADISNIFQIYKCIVNMSTPNLSNSKFFNPPQTNPYYYSP